MNRITVAVEGYAHTLPPWTVAIDRYLITVLDRLGKHNWDLSIVFCTDSSMRELNRQFRGKDEATDVLSFPCGETIEEEGEERYIPGDIVISLETLAVNAVYFKVDQNEELRRLLIHGVLHLDGMDHAGTSASEPMLQIQEHILAALAPLTMMPELPLASEVRL